MVSAHSPPQRHHRPRRASVAPEPHSYLNRKTTTPPTDRPLARSVEFLDVGWDELGPDPLDDYTTTIDRTLYEDRDW